MRRILTASLALAFAATVSAQEEEFEPAKPGPEHKVLQKMVGTWDATVTTPEEGAPPMEGTMVYKMDLGGLWLKGRFASEFLGQKFEGIDTTGYCPIKKKYVSTWIDSMTASPMVGEGEYDAASKTMTSKGLMPGPDGKMMKNRTVTTFVSDDHMRMEMYGVTDEGEAKMMTIDYKRKK